MKIWQWLGVAVLAAVVVAGCAYRGAMLSANVTKTPDGTGGSVQWIYDYGPAMNNSQPRTIMAD